MRWDRGDKPFLTLDEMSREEVIEMALRSNLKIVGSGAVVYVIIVFIVPAMHAGLVWFQDNGMNYDLWGWLWGGPFKR